MRIRRYAARLLSSSANNNPASPQPQHAADWLHADHGTADDCCAFCDLTHSSAQEAPDAIKHKGHIACRVPVSEVKRAERVGLAQGLPAPEAKKCKVDRGPLVDEAGEALGLTNGGSVVTEAAAKPEDARGATLVTKADVKPAFEAEPFVASDATIEQEVKCGGSLVTVAAKPYVSRGNSLVNGRTTELEVLKVAPVANEVAVDPEVAERVSLESKAATLPGTTDIEPDVSRGNSLVNGRCTAELEVLKVAPVANEVAADPEVTVGVSLDTRAVTLPGTRTTAIEPDVTGGCSIMNDSGAEKRATKMASLANQTSTEPRLTERVSLTSKAVTEARVAITQPEVTRTGSLSNEGAVGLEVIRGASPVHGAVGQEGTEADHIASQAARELEDTVRASCRVDDDSASDEQRPPSCDTIGNVQDENTGETVAIAMQPSQCYAADVDSSVSSTNNGPVGTKDPTVEGGVAHDRSVTPSVPCISDVVARSIGRSGRKDVICYVRRRGKRKPDLLEVKMENTELDEGVVCDRLEKNKTLESNGPCESMISRAGSVDIKLVDIKRELMDNSTARKVKKKKTNKFECNIEFCRMTFKTKTELSVHKRNMCTVKSCSRLFISHNYLRRHQSVHNDDMPYRCPWEGCSMAFKFPWDRTEHFQVHAGVKPYKCTTPGCSKIYKFVSDFSRHRRRCKPQR